MTYAIGPNRVTSPSKMHHGVVGEGEIDFAKNF
jgi:hypothetical protein